MKLAFRFAAALVAAMTLALVLNALLRVRREVVLFDEDVATDARTMGRMLGPFVAETWHEEGEQAAKELVANASDREAMQIRLKFLDPAAPDSPTLSSAEHDELLRAGSITRKTEPSLDDTGEAMLVTYVTISLPPSAPAVLEFSEPLVGERAYVKQTIVAAATTAIALALLCAVSTLTLGVFFVGRPVRALVAQARRIGAGDFSDRLGLQQRDEIGELAAEFDLMSERLARARDDLKAATEQRLAALDQLRHVERVATVGKLAAGVAHELGTPLQVVSGYARLITEDGGAGTEARDSAVVIQEQAARMTSIIRQLLDFARPKRSERSLTNMIEVVDKAVRMLGPIAEKSNVRLEPHIAGPEPLDAIVDGEQIIQVLSNLVVNAVQAMPQGGTVAIELDRRRRAGNGARAFIRLCVRDTGIGMPPEIKDHVFEPFFTTKGVGGGTGLGLSVAYGIVEDQGGIFEVDSEPGKGSTFAVWLPVGDEP